jgi:hypothetical protein
MTLAMGTLLIAKEELNDEDQRDAESFFRSMRHRCSMQVLHLE